MCKRALVPRRLSQPFCAPAQKTVQPYCGAGPDGVLLGRRAVWTRGPAAVTTSPLFHGALVSMKTTRIELDPTECEIKRASSTRWTGWPKPKRFMGLPRKAGATATHDLAHADDHAHSEVPSDVALRVKSLESLLVDKGLVNQAALDALIDIYEYKVGPRNGARVVAPGLGRSGLQTGRRFGEKFRPGAWFEQHGLLRCRGKGRKS